MRRQVTLPVLAVILALVAGMVTGAAAQTTDEVRIGIVSPLTGPAAKFGQAQKNAMTMAAEDVNAAGGIKSLGGAKIKLFFGDTRGEADTGVTETERLITRDKVHALIGAFQSGVGFPSSAMAEKHQVPWLTFGTFDKITERGFKYVFRAHANDSIKAKTLIDGLVALGKKAGPIKSAVIMSENTEWGKSVGEKQKNFLEKLGVKVHFVENYPYASPDLTSLIVKAKAVSPDLVVADSYLGDALLITRQMAEQELRPTVYAAGGGGHVQPDFLKGAGKLSEGIFAATMWDAAVGKNVPWIAKDNDRHVARFGAPFTEDSAGYYQALLRDRRRARAHQEARHQGAARRDRGHEHHRHQQQGDVPALQADQVRRRRAEPLRHRHGGADAGGEVPAALPGKHRRARRQGRLAVPGRREVARAAEETTTAACLT